MEFFENITFIIIALLVAIPIALIINYGLYWQGVLFNVNTFDIGLQNIVFVILVILIVGIFAILLGWRMISKETIIDKIRNSDF